MYYVDPKYVQFEISLNGAGIRCSPFLIIKFDQRYQCYMEMALSGNLSFIEL